jgi:glutathione S-transferase
MTVAADDVSTEDVMPYYTAIVTLLAVAFYFVLATRVAAAHIKFDVRLPATAGNADFERIFRAHVNTLEWMPTFLVLLWLCAIYFSDVAAAVLGLVWIAGRIVYFIGYSRAVERRLPGFFIQSTACLLLFIGAAAGLVIHWAHG